MSTETIALLTILRAETQSRDVLDRCDAEIQRLKNASEDKQWPAVNILQWIEEAAPALIPNKLPPYSRFARKIVSAPVEEGEVSEHGLNLELWRAAYLKCLLGK